MSMENVFHANITTLLLKIDIFRTCSDFQRCFQFENYVVLRKNVHNTRIKLFSSGATF